MFFLCFLNIAHFAYVRFWRVVIDISLIAVDNIYQCNCFPRSDIFTCPFLRFSDFVVHVVNNYGLSLQYGNQFIYQSMPRMLALWLDYGAEVAESDNKEKSAFAQQAIKSSLATLNQVS